MCCGTLVIFILNVVCKPSNSSNNQVSLVWWGSCQCPLWLHHPKRTPAPCWTVYPKMCSQHQPPQLEGKHIIHTLFVDGPLTITVILRGCQYASHASKGTQWRSTATGMLFTTTILSHKLLNLIVNFMNQTGKQKQTSPELFSSKLQYIYIFHDTPGWSFYSKHVQPPKGRL